MFDPQRWATYNVMQHVDLTWSWPAQVSGYSMPSWKKHAQNLNLRVAGSLCLFLYITCPGFAICWRNWEDKTYDSMRWPWAVGESKRCNGLKCWTGSSIVYHRFDPCGSTSVAILVMSWSFGFFQGFSTHPFWHFSGKLDFWRAPNSRLFRSRLAQRVSPSGRPGALGTTSSRSAWKLSRWVLLDTLAMPGH